MSHMYVSFVGMSTAKRKILQKLMATEVEIVKSKLEMATAPPRTKALRSYSNLRQDIVSYIIMVDVEYSSCQCVYPCLV